MHNLQTDPSHRVLSALSSGQRHRYNDIAQHADVPLEQLDHVLSQLVDAGIGLTISPQGVLLRSASDVSLLDSQDLLAVLAPAVVQRIDDLKISAVCTSTNDVLSAPVDCSVGRYHVAISDAQTAGRGRQGNLWVSPFGGGIYMSLATQWLPTPQLPDNLPSNLPLAIGVAVAEQLQALVVDSIQLKWPNDLMAKDHKLGGLLMESRPHPAGGYCLVIGVGINLETPNLVQLNFGAESSRAVTALPPIGLRALANDSVLPNRSTLTAMMLNAVIASIDLYRNEGFARFHKRWQQRDYLYRRPIQMHALPGNLSTIATARNTTEGIADGINEDGALRVVTERGECIVNGGEVSVRCN